MLLFLSNEILISDLAGEFSTKSFETVTKILNLTFPVSLVSSLLKQGKASNKEQIFKICSVD